MKLLQITIEVNSGSVGRIAEQIGEVAIAHGWESYITYARNHLPSVSKTIRIGTKFSLYWHGVMTRLFDRHCLHSSHATKELIKRIEEVKPDIIQLHHIHGYYLNMEILFNYLSSIKTPVVWVFHDCWSFTGHCAHYEAIGCDKWQTECSNCPLTAQYPKSFYCDRSKSNYAHKKRLFNSVANMTIVPVSYWMGDQVRKSFLSKYPMCVIQNGIDLKQFYPKGTGAINCVKQKYSIPNDKHIVLGVASTWDDRKGLRDFYKLFNLLSEKCIIVLVGLSSKQISSLPAGIIGIKRTENVSDLASLYSMSLVFVNPTWEDTFPTTNLEAISCGIPVVTYKTGGSTESVTNQTGYVVEKGDVAGINACIQQVMTLGKSFFKENCIHYAQEHFDKQKSFERYIMLYNSLLNNTY